MDERFPPATEEEIREAGGICIICRDDMSEGRRLPCGHVFHFACLRLWLQQQQSCPTCRQDIPVEAPAPARQQPPAQEQEQPQPGAGWAAPRQPEAARGRRNSRRPRSRSPRSASRTCWRRRCGASSTTSRPRSRSRARPRRARLDARARAALRVRATRDAESAPPLRTVPAGEHVLALPDDGEYLRVGDGFILMSELDLLLDETATASAAAETGAASPPRSPAPVEPARAEVARLRAERTRSLEKPWSSPATRSSAPSRPPSAAVQRDVAWLRAREEARMVLALCRDCVTLLAGRSARPCSSGRFGQIRESKHARDRACRRHPASFDSTAALPPAR